MENGFSGAPRGLVSRGVPCLGRAAAIAMAAVLALSGIMAAPARCQGLPALGAGDLAVPYGADIIALGRDGPKRIAPWPGDARPRDAAAFLGGFVAWERKSKLLYRASQTGLTALGHLEAARVYLSSSRAIASNGVFEAGKGFGFTVWSWPGGASGSLKKLAGFTLDCFVSDCLFAGNRAFMAGADASDRANSLYELNLDTGALRRIAMVPKLGDFGRLASDGKRLLFYTSVSEPAVRGAHGAMATLFDLGADGGALGSIPVILDPGIEGASPYGSAFSMGSRFYVPFASGKGAGTKVWLCAFDPPSRGDGKRSSGSGASPAAVVSAVSVRALPTGLYAPIGEAEGTYWAFGFLYVKDPAAFGILMFAPGATVLAALPLKATAR